MTPWKTPPGAGGPSAREAQSYPAGALVKVAAMVGLSLTLAACAGHSTDTGSPGRSGSAPTPTPRSRSGSSAVAVRPARVSVLSGTYSALDLSGWVPRDLYPPGVTQWLGYAQSTGTAVKVDAKYSASDSCSTILAESGGAGWGEQVFLTDEDVNAAETNFYLYAVYEFSTAAEATAFVKGQAAAYARCESFGLAGPGGVVPVSMGVAPASKVPAASTVVDLRESLTAQGGTSVGEFVVAADGNVAVLVGRASFVDRVSIQVDVAQVAESLLEAFAAGEAAHPAGGVS